MHRNLRDKHLDAIRKREVAEQDAKDIQDQIAEARRAQHDIKADLSQLTDEIRMLRRRIEKAHGQWGDNVPDGLEYAETMQPEQIEQREKSAVWADEEFTAARTELFMNALALHKAFIVAESSLIRGNLGALMDILGGRGRPQDRAAVLAAWQTFFLVVPVVSSTFASFDRLFAGLGRESLGWVLIDEAGQVAPQEAVGAVWRAKRTVAVGDPLQLGPVVRLPWGVQQALLREFGVAEEWAPSRTSVQQVADRTGQYGTSLPADTADSSGQIWVGAPLRVHRRCDRPMFDISNQIACDGLMVFGTEERDSFHGRGAGG